MTETNPTPISQRPTCLLAPTLIPGGLWLDALFLRPSHPFHGKHPAPKRPHHTPAPHPKPTPSADSLGPPDFSGLSPLMPDICAAAPNCRVVPMDRLAPLDRVEVTSLDPLVLGPLAPWDAGPFSPGSNRGEGPLCRLG